LGLGPPGPAALDEAIPPVGSALAAGTTGSRCEAAPLTPLRNQVGTDHAHGLGGDVVRGIVGDVLAAQCAIAIAIAAAVKVDQLVVLARGQLVGESISALGAQGQVSSMTRCGAL
jgi:hypothetical protein